MSITVKLWTQGELDRLATDKRLATIFMNCKTFSAHDIEHYPYNQRRTYRCEWAGEPEPVTVYATDERMLWRFVAAEYTRLPDSAWQVITQFRPLKVPVQ